MKKSDLEWIRDNRINIIEFFNVGIPKENPSTLFDVKGERKFVRLITNAGVARVFPLDTAFRRSVIVDFYNTDNNYVQLTEDGLYIVCDTR